MTLLEEILPTRAAAPDAGIWDVLIIGAGPAGSVAASILAQHGWRTLLVERASWPRDKACGGCLNHAGVEMLKRLNLASALDPSDPLTQFSVHLSHRQLQVPIPQGAGIARQDLDANLVDLATARGATFLPQTAARLLPREAAASFRTVRLTSLDQTPIARARIVLAADGLAGTSLSSEPWAKRTTAPRLRLGFSTTLRAPALCPKSTIAMHVSGDGYVGLVQLPDGSVHVGAALSPISCNTHHGPSHVIARILAQSNLPIPADLATASFTGTGPLTVHRNTVAGHRTLAIGDACGYVEPFTGEGISWAIRCAVEATNLLLESPADQLAARWQHRYETQIRRRQRFCRSLRRILHRPPLAALCMNFAGRFPKIPAILAGKIST